MCTNTAPGDQRLFIATTRRRPGPARIARARGASREVALSPDGTAKDGHEALRLQPFGF